MCTTRNTTASPASQPDKDIFLCHPVINPGTKRRCPSKQLSSSTGGSAAADAHGDDEGSKTRGEWGLVSKSGRVAKRRRVTNSCHACKSTVSGVDYVHCTHCNMLYCGRNRCKIKLGVNWESIKKSFESTAAPCFHCRVLANPSTQCVNSNCQNKIKRKMSGVAGASKLSASSVSSTTSIASPSRSQLSAVGPMIQTQIQAKLHVSTPRPSSHSSVSPWSESIAQGISDSSSVTSSSTHSSLSARRIHTNEINTPLSNSPASAFTAVKSASLGHTVRFQQHLHQHTLSTSTPTDIPAVALANGQQLIHYPPAPQYGDPTHQQLQHVLQLSCVSGLFMTAAPTVAQHHTTSPLYCQLVTQQPQSPASMSDTSLTPRVTHAPTALSLRQQLLPLQQITPLWIQCTLPPLYTSYSTAYQPMYSQAIQTNSITLL